MAGLVPAIRTQAVGLWKMDGRPEGGHDEVGK